MKYIGIFAIVAVACLLVAPALSVADRNGSMAKQNGNAFHGNCGQCCGDCHCNGPSGGNAFGAQNQYAQNDCGGNGAGICAQEHAGNGTCDGAGLKRDGSCKAA